MKNKPIIVLGGGGHAGALVDILKRQQCELVAIVSPDKPTLSVLMDVPYLPGDEQVFKYAPHEILLVNGIGSLPGNTVRFEIYNLFKSHGYSFRSVIADNAYVSGFAHLEEGVQVMPRAVVQTGAHIGINTIINTGAIIDHDCQIGAHNHIATGACLSGQVITDSGVHVGTGASVIQSISIGKHSTIGAGATVNKNISDNLTVYPAKVFIK